MWIYEEDLELTEREIEESREDWISDWEEYIDEEGE